MAETTTATSWPASTSRLTWLRDVADAVEIGDRGSAEFHHQAGHGGRELLEGLGRAICRKPPREKARIHSGEVSGAATAAPEQARWQQCDAEAQLRPSTPTRSRVFERLAATWWDPRGKMGVLHKFNPVRLGFIKEAACRQFERDAKRLDSLAGLRILDIGCGGGILSEPLARLGAAGGRRRSGRGQYRGGAAACRARRARDRLPRHHRRGAGRCRRALRHRARHGGGRARRRRAAVRQALRRDGEARRPDDRGDAQPHAQELRAGDRRRRIRAALAAARHPSVGQVRDARRARSRARAARAARSSTRPA